MMKKKIKTALAAIFCTMLWGTAFPFIKLGYAAFSIAEENIGSKLLFAGLRFFLAGIAVLVFMLLRKQGNALPQRNDIAPIALLGVTQTFAQYLFTYIGIGFTSGTNTSVITACSSFFTVLIVPLFFKNDRLTFLKLLGCALGFSGVVIVNQAGSAGESTMFGDVMILFSTLCAVSGNIISKKIVCGRNPVTVTAYQLLIGGTMLIAAGLVCGGKLSLFNLEGTAILLWLAFVSAAAFTVWTYLLKHNSAGKISMFNLLVPIFGTLLSGVMLGEQVFSMEILLSLVLISGGIAAVNISH